MSIALGQGAAGVGFGTFDDTTQLDTCFRPTDIALGDFDDDGIEDLAISCQDEVSVYLGRGTGGIGDGTFNPRDNYDVAPHDLRRLIVADITGDGVPDLLGPLLFGVAVLPGAGGTFVVPPTVTNFTLCDNTSDIAVGDMDSDGIADIVTPCSEVHTAGVALVSSSGVIGDSMMTDVNDEPTAVIIADLNADGLNDIVSNNSTGLLSTLLGDGAGGLLPRVDTPIPTASLVQAAADVNRDGVVDILVGSRLTPSLSVVHGELATAQAWSVPVTPGVGMSATDLRDAKVALRFGWSDGPSKRDNAALHMTGLGPAGPRALVALTAPYQADGDRYLRRVDTPGGPRLVVHNRWGEVVSGAMPTNARALPLRRTVPLSAASW